MDMLDGWQASIGKAILESWGFTEEMCDAIADQRDYERRWQHTAALTDVLIVSLLLADALGQPEPRRVAMDGVNAFATVGLNETDCEATMIRAERRIAVVCDVLK
jgi:HD-like signal output (HDOD) protein